MEPKTPPAPPPRPDPAKDQPGEGGSAEAAQHGESASEIGDRIGPGDEDGRDPDASG